MGGAVPGEELESWAEGPLVNEDADKLLHHRFRVFHELGQAPMDLPEGRQGKFRLMASHI